MSDGDSRLVIRDLLDRLRLFYGPLPAPPSHPFALYVWDVLGRGTTPVGRNAGFAALKRLPALTPDALARAPRARLEAAVAHAGPLKEERLQALHAGIDLFRREPGLADALRGPLPRALRAARRVPHLGQASSMRLLLFAGGHPLVPLDEPALRVARRLGCGGSDGGAGPPTARVLRAVRHALAAGIRGDLDTAQTVSMYFTHHGLTTCTEASPHCAVCPVALDCEWLRHQ
jgi:endonuclease III